MKNPSIHLLLTVLLAFAATTTVAQQTGALDVPRTISYQGLLTSGNGAPLPDGTYDITVALYADESGTQPLWRNMYRTAVLNGIFNLNLGSDGLPLPDPAELNRPLWIGTSVNDGNLMLPLTPLTSSPYALNLPDNAVTTNKLADGAVTSEKMGTPYVAGIALNGQSITGAGTVLNIEVGDGIAMAYDEKTKTLRLSKPVVEMRGDGEKGASVLTNQYDVWSLTGDGYAAGPGGGGATVTPAAGDWIGTSSTSGATFELRTNSQIAMRYQPSGTNTPNVLGGHNTNVIGNGVGNVIAGGGQSGASNHIEDDADYATISGGDTNLITQFGSNGTIGGGHINIIDGQYGTIGGGNSNEVISGYATISGGGDNYAADSYTTIGGGFENQATTTYATVGGGDSNIANGGYSTIGGGSINKASNNYSTVGGGVGNHATGTESTIGGGNYNKASGSFATVAGGHHVLASGAGATIGGGGTLAHLSPPHTIYSHVASGSFSTIAGGFYDTAAGDYSFVGGGSVNRAKSSWGSIAGGDSNLIESGTHSFIGGGDRNTIRSSWAVIGGGRLNVISTTTGASNHSVISGGDSGTIDGTNSFIGGGRKNRISAFNGVIGGGRWNVIEGESGVIVGGFKDTIEIDA